MKHAVQSPLAANCIRFYRFALQQFDNRQPICGYRDVKRAKATRYGISVVKLMGVDFSPQLVAATRFAPSPNGRLHIGHAYAAMCALDFARAFGGQFQLRIEDIDGTRSRPDHIDGIIADMEWLGLQYDGPVIFQSQRVEHYADALGKLRDRGLVYRCWCTRSEIAEALKFKSVRHGPDGPVYPGTCRGVGGRSGRATDVD
jgi:glutamyl/glutaminyl-tRNA synthetase